MSAAIVPFCRSQPRLRLCNLSDGNAGFVVDVPADLARRVAQAALWAEKPVHDFVLAMLAAAFPPGEGAA